MSDADTSTVSGVDARFLTRIEDDGEVLNDDVAEYEDHIWRKPATIKLILLLTWQFSCFGMLMPILPQLKTRFFEEHSECGTPEDCSARAAEASGLTDSLSACLCAVMTPLIGHWSDKYGRKRPLCILMCMSFIPLVALFLYVTMDFSLYVYFAAMVLSLGSRSGFTIIYAALADISSKSARQRAFAGINFIPVTCMAILPSVGIAIQRAYGEPALIGTTTVLAALSVLTAFFLEETFEPKRRAISPIESLSVQDERTPTLTPTAEPGQQSVFSFWRCQWPHVVDLRTACFVMALSSFSLSGMVEIVLFFVQDHLNFTLRQNAMMLFCIGLTSSLTQLFLAVAKTKVSDRTIVLVGLGANWIHLIVFCFAQNAAMMYVSELISGVSMITNVGLQSLVSKGARETEQGSVLGILNSFSTLSSVFAPAFFGGVYGLSRNVFPRAPFLIGAVIIGIAMCVAFKLKRR